MRRWFRMWGRLPRSTARELLDAPDIPARELQGNLDDLRRLNRIMGSRLVVLGALRQLWRQAGCPAAWRLLDIGTGAGDMPLALCRWGRRHGVRFQTVAVDNHRGVVRQARRLVRPEAGLTLVLADARRLPFGSQAFDVVLCSTMLHHLSYDEGIALLRAMAQTARHGIVVNDLRRSRGHYLAARLVLPLLARNRLTRHDGPLSVRRAYSLDELRTMAEAAGLVGARLRPVLGYRVLLVFTRRQ